MSQLSASGRLVYIVAVCRGRVFYALPGDTAWTEATNNTAFTPPLNGTGICFSSANQQKLYFADGVHWAKFVPVTSSVETWAATAGTFPVDSDNNKPRLICTWRGRIVLSGLILDPQNWFMSAVDNPDDFDYSPASITPTQAIAGNNSPMGLIGDVVTNLIPYSDDVLVFGGDHTIYMMRGDPMAGGQIDLISDAIGIAWGQAWCKDPYGAIYFVSNRTGIYTLVPGSQPQRISQQIEQLLQQINTGSQAVRLIWDDRFQGLHVFVSYLLEPRASQHFFYEQRTGAWWTDSFGNKNHNPLCCVTFDGNLPNDRAPLIGSWDGFVRTIDPEAMDDDGTDIESEVVIGPILTKNFDEVMLKSAQAVMGEDAGDVTYAVHAGKTAEQALTNDPVATGTWTAGRNHTTYLRRAAHALYIKITSSGPWSMEAIRVLLATKGKVRMRE